MARPKEKLSSKQIAAAVKKAQARVLGDGGGLWLTISKTGAAKWSLRYMKDRKTHEMGLGAYDPHKVPGGQVMGLAEARNAAAVARALLREGIDPIAQRRKEAAKADAMSFGQVAEQYIASHSKGWRNGGRWQRDWNRVFRLHAEKLMKMDVAEVDTGAVMQILEPLWATLPPTANRLRGRIESILDYAKSRGWREGENPARWRGHIQNLLPKAKKVRAAKHYRAMPYEDVPAFLAKLRRTGGNAAKAMELILLTACRSGEVRGAAWHEFDLTKKVWTIPADRMKAGKEHRVPLSEPAVQVLHRLGWTAAKKGLVFPGVSTRRDEQKPLTNLATNRLLRRIGWLDKTTVHGLRSAFRDWVAEQTLYPREVAEAALAHEFGNATERAYRRSDLFERRRQLMTEWGAFCTGTAAKPVGKAKAAGGNVVPIRPAK